MKGIPRDIFAKRFREKLKAKELTQEDIAKLCRGRKKDEMLSRSAVNQWMKPGGGTLPTLEYLVIAAQAMNASIDYLVGLSSDEPLTNFSQEAKNIALRFDGLSPEEKEKFEKIFMLIADSKKKKKNTPFSQSHGRRPPKGGDACKIIPFPIR